VKPLKLQSWVLTLIAVFCVVQYCLTSSETAGSWDIPANMPMVFTPRQTVAEIWCVGWFVLSLVAGTGAGICTALSRVLEQSPQKSVRAPQPDTSNGSAARLRR
jgi:hypothetical protein